MNLPIKKQNVFQAKQLFLGLAMICTLALVITAVPAFADNPELDANLQSMLTTMIGYIGLIFRVVGGLLLAYSIGQMIMAFKDDNPDAKTKASTMIVVSFILISVPTIIEKFDIVKTLLSS